MGVVLRDYQQDDLAKVRAAFMRVPRVCYQAPTGSGKTVLFSAVVDGAAARGNRTWILGHRQEIVDQICEALDVLGVSHGLIVSGQQETPFAPVQVASVMTLVRRFE